jgi:hypothetical protein
MSDNTNDINALRDTVSEVRVDVAEIKAKVEHLEEVVKDSSKIATIETKLEVLEKLVESFVTRPEFDPVKMITYGMAGSILLTVLGAILAKVMGV